MSDLGASLANDQRGPFTGRVLEFPPWLSIPPSTTAPTKSVRAVSDRSSYVRLVAMRGGIKSLNIAGPLQLALANLMLELSIAGDVHFASDGQNVQAAEFDGLFTVKSQWYWFAAPPILRVGTKLGATVSNTFVGGEGNPSMQPYLMVRIVDEADWRELYEG